ncbi:hypothetical protein KGF57_002924 [Candida theae]|uniref:Uncharacterized protein n=1 Tax=Candida theae TaxID=1198502 RepID=A0AAD5BES5_9ASCO|nr:uncharacterized protein KGF57_002924 [Candida theae]KAI5958116.1 hypothetical protein KGF57_002924 [Candida theae]
MKSKSLKTIKKSGLKTKRYSNEDLQKAEFEYIRSNCGGGRRKEEDKVVGLRLIAEKYNIPLSTLQSRVHPPSKKKTGTHSQRVLSEAQQQAIAEKMKTLINETKPATLKEAMNSCKYAIGGEPRGFSDSVERMASRIQKPPCSSKFRFDRRRFIGSTG